MIIKIGKAIDNDFVINDPHVSRYHAKLIHNEEGWLLEDLSSTNGTFVGDRQLRTNEVVKISPNDSLRIGEHEFILIKEI